MHPLRRRRDRLDHARLIVRRLQREHDAAAGMAGERRVERGKIETPVRRERQDFDRLARKPMAGEDAGMFAAGDQQNLKGRGLPPISRFGVSTRFSASVAPEVKVTFFGSVPTKAAMLLTRRLDPCPRRPAFRVDRGGVAAGPRAPRAWPRAPRAAAASLHYGRDRPAYADHPSLPTWLIRR